MAAGVAPIRARKARYYRDRRLSDRILPPPDIATVIPKRGDDWSGLPEPAGLVEAKGGADSEGDDDANSGIRQEPELPLHEDIAPAPFAPVGEFDFGEDDIQGDAVRLRQAADRRMARSARVASLDPHDGIDL